MRSFALDIASATRERDRGREHWIVDPLTRKVFVRSLTAGLPPAEARSLHEAFETGPEGVAPGGLSPEALVIARVLEAGTLRDAAAALDALPEDAQARLTALSPLSVLDDVRAPVIALAHDRNDVVIPVSESRRLRDALAGRAGARYTEFDFFQHVAPRLLPPLPLVREIAKFVRFTHPLFRVAVSGTPAAGIIRR
jgi:hypothetical protein